MGEELSAKSKFIRNILSPDAGKCHPSLDGISLEMEVLEAVRQYRLLLLRGHQLEPSRSATGLQEFRAKRLKVFDHPRENQDSLQGDAEMWFVPVNFNQGGYDLVHVKVHKSTLLFTFFQVTRSERHSRKYRFFAEFINAFVNAEHWNSGLAQSVDPTGVILRPVQGGPTSIAVRLIAIVRDSASFSFSHPEGALQPVPHVLAMVLDFESVKRQRRPEGLVVMDVDGLGDGEGAEGEVLGEEPVRKKGKKERNV